MGLHSQVNTSFVFGSDLKRTKLIQQHTSSGVGEQLHDFITWRKMF